MRSWRWLLSYITMASLGLGFALVLSLKFVKAARSQTPPTSQAPSSGDLPPEFLEETAESDAKTPDKKAAPPSAESGANPQTPAAAQSTPPPAATPAPSPTPAVSGGVAPTPAAGSAAATPAPANPNEPENLTAPSPAPQMGGEDYTYDPTGRRDPFKPYRTLEMIQTSKPPPISAADASKESATPLEPLQRWDLERLKVIGILWEVRTPKAMVRDPDGEVFTVMKNTKVGRYNGYVAAIREGEVVVVETLEYDGQLRKETKILELGK